MQKPNNHYRYTITDRLGVLIAQPLGESDFSVEWAPDKDNGKRAYSKEFSGDIMFMGEAFQRLLQLEKSIYRCELQQILVERVCIVDGEENWVTWFSGEISLNNGDWDLDGCKVGITFDDVNAYQCLEDNGKEKVNLFDIEARRTVEMYLNNEDIETKNCSISQLIAGAGDGYYWCEAGTPEEGGWASYYHWQTEDDGVHRVRTTRWARQLLSIPCDDPDPGEEWVLIAGCPPGDPGLKVFAKPPVIFNCVYMPTEPGELTMNRSCQVVGLAGSAPAIDNGLDLGLVLQYFMTRFCPGLTVKSDFFQINPEEESTTNYVTGKKSKTRFITLFQKSDVKRPAATGNATKAEWNFDALMTTLKYMFNTEYRIVGNQLVVEHVSFFSKVAGLNLTLPKYLKYTKGKRKYSYKNDEIPKSEEWKWKEQRNDGDFPGLPITYTGCVTPNNKKAVKTYTMEDVMTDVEYALQNSDANNKYVGDDGFVFVATDSYEEDLTTKYGIITENGILGASQLNNSLALAQLMRDYHRHERPLKFGKMNGVDTTFFSVIPTKKGVPISVPLCCGDVFNPDDTIQTALGVGVVDKATFKFKGSMLEVELLYEANTGLLENNAPVATNDVIDTPMDETVYIEVLANDTDADPEEVLTVVIVDEPLHGTAVLETDQRIRYTPEPGYVGNDVFNYRVKDKWGELSNLALITVNVLPL